MHPNEIHHIKAYIVFSLVSALCVGVLVYLYYPLGKPDTLKSSVLDQEQARVSENNGLESDIGGETSQENGSKDDISGRRMRLTQILIRSKKQLQTLEDQRKSSPQGLDPVAEQEIIKLKQKITTIEKMITEIK